MSPSRLSSLDAAFLQAETPTAHMHVGWVAIFDPPDDGPRPSFEDLRDHIERRLSRAPRYRQRILPVPLEISAPVWVDDEDFELSRHVVPARSERLREVVDDCMSEPLRRDRPLWQVSVAPRLEDGTIAIVGKAHHCMVDGIAAVELASLLVDSEPDQPPPRPDDWTPETTPDRGRLIWDGALDLARRELDLASMPARIMRSPQRAVEVASNAGRAAAALLDAARPARPAPALNEPISPLRHLGRLRRPVGELAQIKRAFGVKLNDVLLAASAGGVRRFLRDRGEEPTRLKTMVPVNVRGDGEQGELGNRISFMFVDLPCDEPDPVRRLRGIHAATKDRKERAQPEGADTVIRSLSLAPRALHGLVARLVTSPRTFNLVVSNIPGPGQPLYMRGCPLVEAYPVVPLADEHALSIGVTTVRDGAFFGLYADPESLPDVDDLAEDIDASIDELLELSRVEAHEPEVTAVAGG
jgi:diacylglycerol O-acyltransferase